MRTIVQIISLSAILLLISCNKGAPQNRNSATELPDSPTSTSAIQSISTKTADEPFEGFLEKFLSDANFRYSRIQFPLTGYNSDEDQHKRDNYLFTREDWDFYFEEDARYKSDPYIISTISKKDSTSNVWRLYKENSGYDIKYHFKLKDNQWNLVFYSYMNI